MIEIKTLRELIIENEDVLSQEIEFIKTGNAPFDTILDSEWVSVNSLLKLRNPKFNTLDLNNTEYIVVSIKELMR